MDEACRNAVGAVESSLCSLGTAFIFIGTLATTTSTAPAATAEAGVAEGGGSRGEDMAASGLPFDALVYLSAGFVGSAALLYTVWCLCYHEHVHIHPLFDEASAAGAHAHKHTTQQRRSLEASGATRTHTHLHFHPPWGSFLTHLRQPLLGQPLESAHDHGHAHP